MQQNYDKFPAIQVTVARVLHDSKWELSYKFSVLDVNLDILQTEKTKMLQCNSCQDTFYYSKQMGRATYLSLCLQLVSNFPIPVLPLLLLHIGITDASRVTLHFLCLQVKDRTVTGSQ